jgi:hypothetical protein
MKINFSLIYIFLFSILLNSQSTFFIKYKDDISQSIIENDIKGNGNFILQGIANNKIGKINIDYLAKGLAVGKNRLSKIIKVTTSFATTQNDLNNLLMNDPRIEYVQPAVLYKVDYLPNDSLINQQWALSKIDAFSGWNITQGSSNILLGLIDTGIDYNHPDLKNKVFINPGETGIDNTGKDKKSNKVDDDANGFIDDFMGWDFTDRVGFPFDSTGGDYLDWDNNPMDENSYSHGTAVTGIIGAETNNISGIAGVAPKIKILNLRAFDPGGYGEEDDVAAAILYAVQMGVKAINMSFGDNSFSLVLRDVIRYAYSQNVILVASSGNSSSTSPHYPSGYSEVICVGNSTQDDYVASSSNYGSTLDLVAPGTGILTTIRNGNYTLFNGTSAAAPFVTAAAGLILSVHEYSNEEVKQIIKSTTDDIDQPGWDLKSGAGRLNIFKALTTLAPAIVKFNHPFQDFATSEDSISIYATALSPYFQSCELKLGLGINPASWQTLVSNEKNQFSNKLLSNINLKSYSDTVFTVRLVVQQTNGRTMEERVNFHLIRSAPKGELVSLGPAYYGDKPTIMAAIYTNKPAITKMFYRVLGTQNYFFVTLDGFATNNQFVKQLHYGFIPKQIAIPNTTYELYFELENLVGFKTIIKDSLNKNFIIQTNDFVNFIPHTEMAYSLQSGIIFDQPVNFTSSTKNEILIRENSNSKILNLYKLQNNNFIKLDSLTERIPKEMGDFNNNGKKDLLSYWFYYTYIYEQDNSNSSKLVQKFKKDSTVFWPIMAKDVDKDGITEVLAITNDSTISVYEINTDLSLKFNKSITNFTKKGFGSNQFDSPNGLIADINGDGVNELWMVDMDGDIFSYEFYPNGQILKGIEINTGYIGSAAYLAYGDYDSDGRKDIAVLLHSVESIDIANYHLLTIFNFAGNQLYTIYNNAFIDPASEFNSTFQKAGNSLKFSDIDKDGREELILFTFPYSYILKNQTNKDKIIFFEENINSNSILVADLNSNGVDEIAFPNKDNIKFYEFGNPTKPNTPVNLKGYSIDSEKVKIEWLCNESRYFIYKGASQSQLFLIDSTTSKTYVDKNVKLDSVYFYAVKSYNVSKPEAYSMLSDIVAVVHHTPGKVLNYQIKNSSSVNLIFSTRVNNTIENIQAIYLLDSINQIIYPNSITSSNQFAYLVSFSKSYKGIYKIIVDGLKDYYGSPIKKDTISIYFNPVIGSQEFFVESYEIINSHKLKLVFNLEYDFSTINITQNYIFNPENQILSIETLNSNNREVVLNLKNPVGSIGKEYRLQLQNIRSSFTNGSISINMGAGSVLLLAKYANDLSEVYFYPSPARIVDGVGSLTFANLPKYTEISIWGLNGKRITTLNEVDGNGGYTWNLKDSNGEFVNSGIYIYRIIQLDELKNEVGSKLGKIAIVR